MRALFLLVDFGKRRKLPTLRPFFLYDLVFLFVVFENDCLFRGKSAEKQVHEADIFEFVAVAEVFSDLLSYVSSSSSESG